MRLLKFNNHGDIELTKDLNEPIPAYAILSHTWAQNNDDEVTFSDIQTRECQQKAGYEKIKFCVKQARRDSLEYCWVDTCCIDKTNHVELSEAITSMYKWYRNARKCYVYLSDVPSRPIRDCGDVDKAWISSFCSSRWFTRGWTLQELIAPAIVEFFSQEEVFLGTRQILAEQISQITTIPLAVLYGSQPTQFPIAERWRWVQKRETKKKEDKAYCLFGIFDVFLPLIYGEGEHAFRRLEEEVGKRLGTSHRSVPRLSHFANENAMAWRPVKRVRPQNAGGEAADTQTYGQDHGGDINIYGLGSVHLRDRFGSDKLYHDDADKFDIFFRSLLFSRIDFRVNNVKKALLSTCKWLFCHPHFQNWYNNTSPDEHNGFLWIKGKPGCGKSTLMKAALQWACKRRTRIRQRQVIVPYFFNARASAPLEKSPLGLYRTVVYHLLSSYDFLQPLFMDKFASKNVGSSGDDWTIEELQEFLYDSVESGHSFEMCLFIDALDEAEHESDVRQMIDFLAQLADRASAVGSLCQLQICLSSRHYPHISIGRGFSLVVEDQPEHDQDIAVYTARQLTCADGSEKDELQVKILEKSVGIFLWVVLVVEMLNTLDDHGAPLSDMLARLETTPADLNELFQDVLLKSDHGIATSILFLQWIVFGMRALEPAELYVALHYSQSSAQSTCNVPGTAFPPTHERLARYILNCSRGLVEIVEVAGVSGPIVQFIHETVREFLLKDDGLAAIAPALATNISGMSHETLRIACQRCVEANILPDEYRYFCEATHKNNASWKDFKSDMRSRLPFLDYAISYLFYHAEQAQRYEISQRGFLKSQTGENDVLSDSYRLWWNVLERYKSRKLRVDTTLLYFVVEHEHAHLARELLTMLKIDGKFGAVLSLALFKEDNELVRTLLDNGVDVNTQEGKQCNALSAALQMGCLDIAQLLLGRGADPNSKGGSEEELTVLQEASMKGYADIVQLLLAKGADANARGGKHGTALYIASERGFVEVVQLLLDHGADIDAQEEGNGTALYISSERGFLEVVQLLLDKGADVNASAEDNGTALYIASERGLFEIVQLLLAKGADANARGGKHGTALYIASERGFLEIVQLLLDKGADVNAQGGRYGTALQAASIKGHTDIVQRLLCKIADISAQAEQLSVALYTASDRGYIKIVQALLDNGADVNAQGGKCGVALQVALKRGRTKIVQLLLDKGADVNVEAGKHGTALQIASTSGHTNSVQILLDKGADVNAQGGTEANALQAASASGHIEVVQLLLNKDANVNAEGGKYGTALQAAATEGHTDIVQLLLDNGADINARGRPYGTAMCAASYRGHTEIVQLLLAKGADVNARGGKQGAALQIASAGGHAEVVQLLLDHGADIDAQEEGNGTALYIASERGLFEIVQLLLDKGADVNASGGKYGRALQAASKGAHIEILQLLYSYGANI